MNIKENVVIHKVFGEGTVVDHTDNYLTVLFNVGEKKFVYSDSFKNFLKAKDSELNAKILNELAEIERQKIEAEQEKKRFALLERERLAEQQAVQRTPKVKIYPRENIAFKCNFCDGGKTAESIGFNGLCSDEIIRHNVKVKRPSCSSDYSPCKKYYDGEIKSYDELKEIVSKDYDNFVCYESIMLRDWKASAGIAQTGEPMRLMKVQVNSLAVLTTRLLYESDENRFIFAVFLVDETYEGDTREEGYVSTNSNYKIELTPTEAKELKFWNYYFCANAPEVIKFGSGLHRYLSDEQAAQILRDIAEVKKGTAQEELAQEFFEYFCKINGIDIESIPQNNGALMR